jgi:hypothetical protein
LHRLASRQRLDMRGVRGQRGVVRRVGQARMRLVHEAQRAGHRDIGMARCVPEPPRPRPGRALGLQRGQHAQPLHTAALGPNGGNLAAQALFVAQADRLLGQARGAR